MNTVNIIPRSSIDEANRHLQQLHKRALDLEITVANLQETLVSQENLLQSRIAEVASAKEKEIESLAKKLVSSERTVSLLQEDLEHKRQQVLALQQSHTKLRRLLNFKDDIKDLLKSMNDAEDSLVSDEGDTDGLLSLRQPQRDTNNGTHSSSFLPGKRQRRKKLPYHDISIMSADDGAIVPSEVETAPNFAGKEFYL